MYFTPRDIIIRKMYCFIREKIRALEEDLGLTGNSLRDAFPIDGEGNRRGGGLDRLPETVNGNGENDGNGGINVTVTGLNDGVNVGGGVDFVCDGGYHMWKELICP